MEFGLETYSIAFKIFKNIYFDIWVDQISFRSQNGLFGPFYHSTYKSIVSIYSILLSLYIYIVINPSHFFFLISVLTIQPSLVLNGRQTNSHFQTQLQFKIKSKFQTPQTISNFISIRSSRRAHLRSLIFSDLMLFLSQNS